MIGGYLLVTMKENNDDDDDNSNNNNGNTNDNDHDNNFILWTWGVDKFVLIGLLVRTIAFTVSNLALVVYGKRGDW